MKGFLIGFFLSEITPIIKYSFFNNSKNNIHFRPLVIIIFIVFYYFFYGFLGRYIGRPP